MPRWNFRKRSGQNTEPIRSIPINDGVPLRPEVPEFHSVPLRSEVPTRPDSPPTQDAPPAHENSRKLKKSPKPTVSSPKIQVRRNHTALECGRSNGLEKMAALPIWNRVLNQKSVSIEAAESCAADSIFYAPEGELISETEFVRCDTQSSSDLLVRRDEPFEISVVGMSVCGDDFSSNSYNKVVMYSTRQHAGVRGENESAGTEAVAAQQTYETGSSASDVIHIHYDPMSDKNDEKLETDVFLHIPASKSMYMSTDGRLQAGKQELEHSVNCRFNVMEIDEVNDSLARAVCGIDESVDSGRQGDDETAFLPLVTSLYSIMNNMGTKGLKKYKKPDHVLKTDFTFLLAESKRAIARQTEGGDEEGSKGTTGDYLRYGYYFFLNKAVDGKLYAHTGSSSQHVPLKLRRTDKLGRDEQEYFGLTGVSYLVVRVCRKTKAWRAVTRSKAVKEEHGKRVKNLTRMGSAVEAMSTMAN